MHSHGRARGSKFQLPNNVRLVLYNGKDEGSTYAEPRSPEEYEKLISDESGSELHSLEKMLAVWRGARGGWCAYGYGSEAPDLYFCGKNSFDFAVFFRRPFKTIAHTSEYSATIPVFKYGLRFLQMSEDAVEDQKDIVGAELGFPPNMMEHWELQKSHDDIYFFNHRLLDTSGKWTKKLHLIVKGTVVKFLSDLVPMFSADSQTTLFVHACTTDVQF